MTLNAYVMAKDPAFPFYAQDYLVDTIRWSRAMQGLHVSLLAESWANGGLVDDGGMPGGLGSTDVDVWLKIKHKWNIVDGLWINDKLEEVRKKRNVFREKQREKGILSAESRKKQPTKAQPKSNSGSTVVEPLENENENIIVFGIKNKYSVSVKKKYASEKPKIIYDLKVYFESKLDQFNELGWNLFDEFMADNPSRVFDDDDHLYNSFKKFCTSKVSTTPVNNKLKYGVQ
jgi:hypothetical protein